MEILKYPHFLLRKKSEEVKEITLEIKHLIEEMIEIMKKNEGIGIAAPQVGVLKRIIVIQTLEGPKALLNPKILQKSKETEIEEEGCLSLPGIFLKIKRPKLVEVEALDIEGKKISLKKEELLSKSPTNTRYPEGINLSRVIQHEIDHLDGILIISKIPFWQRWKIRKKLKLLEKSNPISKFLWI